MDNNRFRRQFLFTTQTTFPYAWERIAIQECNLYYHPELELTTSKVEGKELVMIGAMYDWEDVSQTNQQLLDKLIHTYSFDSFLTELARYAGQYMIIYKTPSEFFILNDVCAQHEIYYDTSFTSFGSQPKLIMEVVESKSYALQGAIEFYSSQKFLSKRLYVGETTHVANIKHLLPNHYIDITHQTVKRYFPYERVGQIPTNEVAVKACQMLKGYIKAVALRKKIAMAVTGGYDSRVLFLASLDEDCKYFVSQHKNMSDNHYDIAVPQKVTKMYHKPFEVIPDKDGFEDISDSIDFPRNIPKPGKYFDGHVYLNGNISEIARNAYGFSKKVTPEDLTFISGYDRSHFVKNIYQHWLENATLFKDNGYDILDMYYWEEKMGTRVAKEKTMMHALGKEEFSPFCSRDLLVLLLSTPHKDRDYYINKLYNVILLELSSDALKIPINPCLKLDIIRLMTRLNLYPIYRNLGLKYHFLKF